MKVLKTVCCFSLLFSTLGCQKDLNSNDLPDIIVSTDIGGSDPDDQQSMVHLLVYADRFNIKGLISSPPKQGRKEHIIEVLNAYEEDYEKLKKYSDNFPTPEYLISVSKQGATEIQITEVPAQLSEGAAWIIQEAEKKTLQPLYILVWGSLTDVAQAVHHSPEIKKKIRVYSIGSWNTKQDPNSRNYLFKEHADLWWIESNTTFRGMYMGGYQEGPYGNTSFVENCIKDYGALGELFWEKKIDIKMGDSPSVLYFLDGNINNPESESWGGSYIKTSHGPNYWTDNPADSLVYNKREGANTVNKFRREFLDDWANRMKCLKN